MTHTVTTIWKRAQITAYAIRDVVLKCEDKALRILENSTITASGHWDTEEGVYCGIDYVESGGKGRIVKKRMDVILKPEDFRIFVHCEWMPKAPPSSPESQP